MTPSLILGIIGLYFLVLLAISLKTGSQDDNQTFFTANKNAKWYIVAFGMVGTSLSGVTFISVPGWVQSSQFTYFQVVLGYGVGYWLVSFVLLPLYYKQGLTSIYEYLADRFGPKSHLVGAFSFFISRILGAAFRLFLVAIVLQQYVFAQLGIPFEITVILSVALIWFYTHRGGIQTIVWTDSLQTLLMIVAVVLSIVYMGQNLNLSTTEIFSLESYPDYNRIWIFDDPSHRQYFWKAFIGGAFITLCMTGLDQDMMQKNLSCRNLREAQKNMLSFSLVLVGVTALFLLLGALNYNYATANSIALPVLNGSARTDLFWGAGSSRGRKPFLKTMRWKPNTVGCVKPWRKRGSSITRCQTGQSPGATPCTTNTIGRGFLTGALVPGRTVSMARVGMPTWPTTQSTFVPWPTHPARRICRARRRRSPPPTATTSP